ncbi:MAG: hypothetical protein HW377_1897 [Actinobacteria bacterium]|nr:hypothetical protein [Actinomycetota bacterium]
MRVCPAGKGGQTERQGGKDESGEEENEVGGWIEISEESRRRDSSVSINLRVPDPARSRASRRLKRFLKQRVFQG